MKSLRHRPPLDLSLVVLVCGIVGFGLLMVYSSSYIYAQERAGDGLFFIRRQLIFASVGLVAMWLASLVNVEKLRRYAYPALGLSVLTLALVFIPGLGQKVGGAQRWVRAGILSFQPAEAAKLAVIIFVARQLCSKQAGIRRFVPSVMAPLAMPAVILLLLLRQPDFGTAALMFLVTFSMMFLAGVRGRYLASIAGLGGLAGAALVLGSSYRRARLMTFLDPWSDPAGRGFQILQSFVGLNQGKLLGVGLGNSREKLFFLPEAHNDFILAVIGEELGWIGVTAVVVAVMMIVVRGLQVSIRAYRQRNESFSFLVASGITLNLGYQSMFNCAVVLGLLPTKGINLPLISYGGSSIVVQMTAIGLLLAVSRGLTAEPSADASDELVSESACEPAGPGEFAVNTVPVIHPPHDPAHGLT